MQIGRLYNGVGPLRTTDISHNPVSTTLAVGDRIYLPTAEPAEDDFSYTITEGHLPSITGSSLQFKLCAFIYHGGFNQAASLRNVSYRFLLNDVSLRTGFYNAAANQHWTWLHNDTFDLKVGDKFSCRVWSTDQDSDIYWDYQGLLVLLTRVFPMVKSSLSDLTVSTNIILPAGFAGGVLDQTRQHVGDGGTLFVNIPVIGYSFGRVSPHSAFGVYRTNRGDVLLTSIARSGQSRQTNYPRVVTSLSYRQAGDI